MAVDHPDRVDRLVLNTAGGSQADPEVMKRIITLSMAAAENPTWETVQARIKWLMADKSKDYDDIVASRQRVYRQPGFVDAMRDIMALQDPVIRARNLLAAKEYGAIERTDVGGVDQRRSDGRRRRGAADRIDDPEVRGSRSWRAADTGRSTRTPRRSTGCTSTSCWGARERRPGRGRRHRGCGAVRPYAGEHPRPARECGHSWPRNATPSSTTREGSGLDDEALRTFQSIGLADRVLPHTVPNQILRFFDGKRRLLAEMAPPDARFGWPKRNGFVQPMVDAELFRGLDRFDHVEVRFGRRMQTCVETADGVTVEFGDGGPPVRARYVVGCDGGRSATRRLMGVPSTAPPPRPGGSSWTSPTTRWAIPTARSAPTRAGPTSRSPSPTASGGSSS